jgi:LPS-assembly lipoprotein
VVVKIIKAWVLGAIIVVLTSCGFSLRGAFHLPAEIKTIQLSSTAHNTSLERALTKRLKPYKLELIDTNSAQSPADLTITLLPDALERRLLSLFNTGQVAEYELVYTVKYQLQFAQDPAQAVEFTVTREYQDDPDAVLAKSRELDLVLAEMRQQAADRIIRQISTSYANRKTLTTL